MRLHIRTNANIKPLNFDKTRHFYSYFVHIIGSTHSIPTVSGKSVLIVHVFCVQSTPTFSVILDSKYAKATVLGDLCTCSNDFRHISPIDVTPEGF